MIIDVNIKKNLLRSFGFTLVELMIVVAVVAILATITIPSYLHQRQRNDVAEAIRLAKNIRDENGNRRWRHTYYAWQQSV